MERHTRQRGAIRQIIAEAGRPLSIREIHTAASRLVRGLGIATVYRTLRELRREGDLLAVELPAEPARYELAGKVHHHHFRCRSCDRVYDVEGCVTQLRALVPRNFRLEDHELTLYGQCAACA
jgi:Fur family ferric uptake transcriptional regulator